MLRTWRLSYQAQVSNTLGQINNDRSRINKYHEIWNKQIPCDLTDLENRVAAPNLDC